MVTSFPGLANTGMSAIETDKSPDSKDDGPKAAKAADPVARSSASAMSRLALLVALLALTAAAWTGWQLLALQDVPSLISGDAGKIQDLSRRLDDLAQKSGRQQQLVDDLEDSLEAGLGAIPEISLRIDQSEKKIANIPGINPRIRSDWFKTEALYYLKIANAQASLTGNAQIAARALQLADDNLRDAGDPSLTPVRAQLSAELTALKSVPVVDRTGISLGLQSLAAQAGNWSFRNTAPSNYSPELTAAAETEAPGYWDRFVATLKTVFSSIVSVKETDARHAAQLSSAEEAMIVEVVRAELQLARLALISSNDELFGQSLGRVNEQIGEYFDGESAAVAAALATVVEMQALQLPGPLPDISGSLTLLRGSADGAANNTGSREL